VLLVCSSGGHLAQLHQLKPWWQRRKREWVCFDTADGKSLLRDEVVHWAARPTTRNIPNLLRNARLAWRLCRRGRVAIVISDGAGVAFPFFVVARFRGIPTVYIEVYERITSHPTLTGRLCYPLSSLFLLQWEEQLQLYPKGTVIGPIF
jgi:UDP-N-acetylglucosamine:LPS N-acetylglucosamine transferase